jgi:hypothetical protein
LELIGPLALIRNARKSYHRPPGILSTPTAHGSRGDGGPSPIQV